MPVQLTPIKAVKCTYVDCVASFDTEKDMKRHKKYSKEHDYCHKCDEDFESYDALARHKAFRPDNHDKACRICGEEFKSDSGLKRHIEITHKVDQKIPCVGCQSVFYRASLLVEHLEFGHCDVISPQQFSGHIVHKFLIDRLLNNPSELDRFKQKISKHDAAIDHQEDGGVTLGPMDEGINECLAEPFEPIQAEIEEDVLNNLPKAIEKPWPELPSEQRKTTEPNVDQLSKSVAIVTITEDSGQQPKHENVWAKHGVGASASKALFKNAEKTPVTEEWSLQQQLDNEERDQGINILKTRFWDPTCVDYDPERFYEPATQEYYCPFVCEQMFAIPSDLNRHILFEHRITSMRCPRCLKIFKSATALIAHCEGIGTKCTINKAEDFSLFLDRLTGGFLGATEHTHPAFEENPTVKIRNERGDLIDYCPPVASYLQYEATKPADWNEPQVQQQSITYIGYDARESSL